MSELPRNPPSRNLLLDAKNASDEASFIRSKEVIEAMQRRERELEQFHSMLQAEHAEREQRIYKEMAEREKALKDREDSLRSMAKENEKRAAVM